MSSSSDRPSDRPTRELGSRWLDFVRVFLLTSGGLGLSGWAPGTFGTIGGVLLAIALEFVPGLPFSVVLALGAFVCTVVGVLLGPWAERYFGKKDPGAIVLDEVAGYLVTVAIYAAAVGHAPTFFGHCVAFVLFRIADIAKFWPARHLEALPHGYGVMLDDVVLALYSGAACALLGLYGESFGLPPV